MSIENRSDTPALDQAIQTAQAATQAATRAQRGEFIFATRAEVTAFVCALPPEVGVRWTFQPGGPLFPQGYHVQFWRSFSRTAFTAPETKDAGGERA